MNRKKSIAVAIAVLGVACLTLVLRLRPARVVPPDATEGGAPGVVDERLTALRQVIVDFEAPITTLEEKLKSARNDRRSTAQAITHTEREIGRLTYRVQQVTQETGPSAPEPRNSEVENEYARASARLERRKAMLESQQRRVEMFEDTLARIRAVRELGLDRVDSLRARVASVAAAEMTREGEYGEASSVVDAMKALDKLEEQIAIRERTNGLRLDTRAESSPARDASLAAEPVLQN